MIHIFLDLFSGKTAHSAPSFLPTPSLWSSQCTSPKHPVSCIEPGLATRFIHDILHVSMPFSQIAPPSPSPTESIRLIYTSVSLLLSRTQGCCYHLSKVHILLQGQHRVGHGRHAEHEHGGIVTAPVGLAAEALDLTVAG